jgi:hypothetical protein
MRPILSLLVVLTVAAAVPSVRAAHEVPARTLVASDAVSVNRLAAQAHVPYPWVVYVDFNGSGNWLEFARYTNWYSADQAARNLFLNFGYRTRILYRY